MIYALRLQEGDAECRETGLPRRACCLTAAIGGAAIDHHILQLRTASIRRKQHALNRLLQMRSLVIGGRDDGNFREELDKINRI